MGIADHLLMTSNFIILILFFSSNSPAQEKPCLREALARMQALATDKRILKHPHGIHQVKGHIDCSDLNQSISPVFHEAVHGYSSGTNSYPLLNGESRPHIEMDPTLKHYPKPAQMRPEFGERYNASIYLNIEKDSEGQVIMNSGSNFGALLDELNAYTHQLDLELKVPGLNTGAAPGLISLSAFFASYLNRLESGNSESWRDLQTPMKLQTIRALWDQAEKVLARACRERKEDFEMDENSFYRRYLCDPAKVASLSKIMGRPTCPTKECLGTSTSGSTNRPPAFTDAIPRPRATISPPAAGSSPTTMMLDLTGATK